MKVLFLDESGDHNLSVIDPQYPVFVLGGVIMDKEYAEVTLEEAFNEFKYEMLGSSDIILHTADIIRNRNGFEAMQDRGFRNHFYNRLNSLMRDLQYSVIACVIHKDEYLSRYGVRALDPYMISLNILVESFCFEIGDESKGGAILVERRDPTLDRSLELAWMNLKLRGTTHLQGRIIEGRISSLDMYAKNDNIAGLQMADLVVSPIGRYALGKPLKEDWEIVESKLRRSGSGRVEDYGLTILPRQKERPAPATQ